ncbi:thiamine-phosphate kinase [Desulfovibrio ferrophilus]|uniref:Thiamine-monophosphate kinase n=1 Tax=Desulfovibrio ferrophilus TaxID=241368 RepID=A0A2Z6B363_9BACT|nr:thiamine-phosphate kinase [Desulfovibrio ferrophilus]BBD09942.1 thiamine-monophosphate kinase [Desulfovibrio ferrophilus]
MPQAAPASEQEFLTLIDRHFPNAHQHMPVARGDDCVQLVCPPDMVLSGDLFLQDIHFRTSYFSPADIGWKALAVNISDIAAMGCKPLGFSLGLMVPPAAQGLSGDFWNELFQGMAALAALHDLPLTGGDLSQAPMLGLNITIWGEPGPQGRVLQRRRCWPDDVLLTVGRFGLVRTGLMALEQKGPQAIEQYPQAVAAHLRPHPRVTEGLELAARRAVRGCMDLSDGLAQDLPRFLGPALGAQLDIPKDTLHPETLAWTKKQGLNPVQFAYLGGEDYALLACVAPAEADVILGAIPDATRIGTVTGTPGITLNGNPVPSAGFDHFANT